MKDFCGKIAEKRRKANGGNSVNPRQHDVDAKTATNTQVFARVAQGEYVPINKIVTDPYTADVAIKLNSIGNSLV